MTLTAIDGPFLREQRMIGGWTIDDFAKASGISRQYLSDIENGRRLLKRRPDLIRKMADTLGLPVIKLYRSNDEAPVG